MEDDYTRPKSIAKLNREIREYRRSNARAVTSSGVVETLTIEKDRLSSIVFRRKSQLEREEQCNRRIDVIQREIDTKFASAQKCENKNADLHRVQRASSTCKR